MERHAHKSANGTGVFRLHVTGAVRFCVSALGSPCILRMRVWRETSVRPRVCVCPCVCVCALARAYLGEAAVVVGHGLGVGAVQLLDDLEALVELCEHVHHGAGEQSVLRRLLELDQDTGRQTTHR